MKTQLILFNILHSCFAITEKKFLKIGMLENIPGYFPVTVPGTNDTRYVGPWTHALKWLSQRSDFSYQATFLGKEIGFLESINGSQRWTGAIRRLTNQEFDMLAPPILLTLARVRALDYAGIAEDEKSALLTPPPTEQSSVFSTLRPYKLTVWLALIFSLFLASCSFALTFSIFNGRIEWGKLSSLLSYFLYTIAILTSQGELFYRKTTRFRLSFRFTGAGLCLLAVVVVNVYSSTLTSYITTRKMNRVPESSIEVVEEGVLDYVMIDHGLGRDIVMGATSGPLKKMAEIFRRKPENFIPDQEAGFLRVASGCCAYSDFVSYLEFRIAKDFQEHGKCRVHMGPSISGYGFTGVVLRKNDPNRKKINQGILEMYQAGLIEYWRREVGGGKASVCSVKKNNKPSSLRRLNLRDLGSVFFILAIGVALSLASFIAEQFGRRNQCRHLG